MQAKFKVGDQVRVKLGYGTCLLKEDREYTVEEVASNTIMVTVYSNRSGKKLTLDYNKDNFVLIERPTVPTIASDLKITPQARSVLKRLKTGKSISPMQALHALGISRLASCIHEIRNRAGYDVYTELKRDEHGGKYAKYTLATVH